VWSDKTHLNNKGSHHAHEVVVSCANWEVEYQTEIEAKQIVAHIPTWKNSYSKDKSLSSICGTLLFHRSWSAMLRNIKEIQNEGLFCESLFCCINFPKRGIQNFPTCYGRKWIYPVLGPYNGDLQELYKIPGQYCANFEKLSRACIGCSVSGSELPSFASFHNQDFSKVNNCIRAIKSGEDTASFLLTELKSLSLHPECFSRSTTFFCQQ